MKYRMLMQPLLYFSSTYEVELEHYIEQVLRADPPFIENGG